MRAIKEWFGFDSMYNLQRRDRIAKEEERTLIEGTPIGKLTIKQCITIAIIFAEPILKAFFIAIFAAIILIALVVLMFGMIGLALFMITGLFHDSPIFVAGSLVFAAVTFTPVIVIYAIASFGDKKVQITTR